MWTGVCRRARPFFLRVLRGEVPVRTGGLQAHETLFISMSDEMRGKCGLAFADAQVFFKVAGLRAPVSAGA